MNRHLIARKDAESWRKSRRRKDANFLSKRRARLRPLAFGLAVLLATTSPLTAWATGTGMTTNQTPSSSLYTNNATPGPLTSVGQGGCAQQYAGQINTDLTNSGNDLAGGFISLDAGLAAQAVGLGTQIAGLGTQTTAEGVETGTDAAEAATLASEDVFANPSPAAPEAATAVAEGTDAAGS